MKIFTVAQLEKDKDFAGLKRWVLDTVIKGEQTTTLQVP